jgi:hypothetical protein
MSLNLFGAAKGIGHIQLEDGLRKKGPTINSDRLVLDNLDTGGKDDSADFEYAGEPIDLETEQNTNLGVGIAFTDFYKFGSVYSILLNGTTENGADAGDVLVLESPAGGNLITEEDNIISLPMTDFSRPDLMVMEAVSKHSEYGRILLNGSAINNGAPLLQTDEGSQLLLDGTDHSGFDAGSTLLIETDNERNKSHDDKNDVTILMETHHVEGGFFLREYGGYVSDNAPTEGDMILIDRSDSDGSNAGDKFIQEDTPDVRITQDSGAFILDSVPGEIILEDGTLLDLIVMNGTDSSSTDAGDVIVAEGSTLVYIIQETSGDDPGTIALNGIDSSSTDADENILLEPEKIAGNNILLEKGSIFSLEDKLLLDSQAIECEDGSNDANPPISDVFGTAMFPDFTRPSEIKRRSSGHIALQDEQEPFNFVFDRTAADGTNAGSNLLLNGTTSASLNAGGKIKVDRHQGRDTYPTQPGGIFVFDRTDASGSNAGGNVDLEIGTYSSMLGTASPFFDPGDEAFTFDNTTLTTWDETTQTFDTLSSD